MNILQKKRKGELGNYEQAKIMIRYAVKSGKAILYAVHQKKLLKYLMK